MAEGEHYNNSALECFCLDPAMNQPHEIGGKEREREKESENKEPFFVPRTWRRTAVQICFWSSGHFTGEVQGAQSSLISTDLSNAPFQDLEHFTISWHLIQFRKVIFFLKGGICCVGKVTKFVLKY